MKGKLSICKEGKRKTRKSLTTLAMVGVMALTFGTSAMAANTEDTSFYTTWNYSEPSFQLIQNASNSNYNHYVYRKKTDSSKVFFKMTGPTTLSYVYTKVCGVPSSCVSSTGYGSFTRSDTVNLTYNPSTGKIASYAKCNIGTGYSISSLVYERGYTYCTLQIESSLGYGTGTGYWSPDSAYTHSTPTYVS